MKNFLKSVLAVILGNTLFFGFFFFLGVVLLFVFSTIANSSKNKLKENTVIYLNLKTGLSDLSQRNDLKINIGGEDENPASIHDVIKGIKKAKEDENIKALWINLNYNEELTYAQLDLLRAAVQDFKLSNKPVISYGEVVSQKMYYLSTSGDKIYINPQGGIDIRGFAAQLTFFKKTLDKLEIQPQIFYAGKFKSATEPFRLEKMSEENKTQTKELLTDISSNVLTSIAKDRKITVDELNQAIVDMRTNLPDEAKQAYIIDDVKYLDQVEDELKSMLKLSKTSKLNRTSIYHYIEDESYEIPNKSGIAVYVAEGEIVDGKAEDGKIGSESMIKDIRAMAEDKNITAVVLRVNSPGGSALASDVILRELSILKKKKPLVVSMGNVAASGGYYISSLGEKIFAEKNTITGSIGVFGIMPNIGKMMENKFGVTFDEVEIHEHAAMGIHKNFDALESQKMQQAIDRIYLTFKSVVSQGRKIQLDSVENIAQGRVWSGSRAKLLQLVDEIGGLDDAINYASTKTSDKNKNYFFFNTRKSEFELLMEDLFGRESNTSIEEKWLKSKLGSYSKYYDMLKSFENIKGAQMRMMYQVVI